MLIIGHIWVFATKRTKHFQAHSYMPSRRLKLHPITNFSYFLMSSYSAEFRRVSFEHKASRLSSLFFFFYLLLIKPIHRKEMSLKKGEVNLGVGLSLYEIEINHS